MAWAARTLHSVAAARGVSSTKASHKVEFDKHQGKAKHARSAAAERQKQAADGAASTGIWVCALLQTIVPLVPMASTTPSAPGKATLNTAVVRAEAPMLMTLLESRIAPMTGPISVPMP